MESITNFFDDFQRLGLGAAAGTVGDRDKARLVRSEFADGSIEGFKALRGLRGEDLEGEDDITPFVEILDGGHGSRLPYWIQVRENCRPATGGFAKRTAIGRESQRRRSLCMSGDWVSREGAALIGRLSRKGYLLYHMIFSSRNWNSAGATNEWYDG
jgi:hypothetical protein